MHPNIRFFNIRCIGLDLKRPVIVLPDSYKIPISIPDSFPMFHTLDNIHDTSELYQSQYNTWLKIPPVPYATDNAAGVIQIPIKLNSINRSTMTNKETLQSGKILEALQYKPLMLPKTRYFGEDGLFPYLVDNFGKKYHYLSSGGYRSKRTLNFIESNAILLNETVPIPDKLTTLVKTMMNKLVHRGHLLEGVFYTESGLVYYGEE